MAQCHETEAVKVTDVRPAEAIKGMHTAQLEYENGKTEVYYEDFMFALKCMADGAISKAHAGLHFSRIHNDVHVTTGNGGFTISVYEARRIAEEADR